MENEIMETEIMDNEVEIVDMENEGSGVNVGLVALIGVGVVAATTAAITLGKKLYAKYKERKELRKPADDTTVEVTDEDIESVTK